MITKFPNTISGKNLLPLSFLFLFLPNWSSVTVYGYTFPQIGPFEYSLSDQEKKWTVLGALTKHVLLIDKERAKDKIYI